MIHQFQQDRGSSMGDASQQNAYELMADGFIGEISEMLLPNPIKGQGAASERSAHVDETEVEDDLHKMESNELQVASGHDNSSLLRESLQSGNKDSPLSIKAAETDTGNNVDAENGVQVLGNKFMNQDGNNGTINKAAIQQELPKRGLEQDRVMVDGTLPVLMHRSDGASKQAPNLSMDRERASSAGEMPLDIPASADTTTALPGDPLGLVQPVPLPDHCANGKSCKGLVPNETMMSTALAGADGSTGGNCHPCALPSNLKASNEDVVGRFSGTTTDKPTEEIFVSQAVGSPIAPFSSGFQKASSEAGPELWVGMDKHLRQAQATAQEAMASATSALAQSQVVWTRMQSLKPSDLGPVLESQIASVAATVAAAASVAKAAVEAAKAISEACKEAYSQANGAHGEGFLQVSTIGGGLGQSDNVIGITQPVQVEPMQATDVDNFTESGAGGVQAEVNNTMNTLVSQKGKPSKSKNVQDSLPVNGTSNEPQVQGGHILPTKKPLKKVPPKKTGSVKGKQVIPGEPGDDGKRLLKQKGEVTPESISVSAVLEMAAGAPQRPNSTELGGDGNMINIPEAIRVGSLVEVMSEEEGLRGGWFSGKVLALAEQEALVAYDELLTDDGGSNLKEWFPREGRGLSGPHRRMRPMHPISSVRETGSKKRRLSSGCQVWAVGDHVDAFIQDGWWEGVVRAVNDVENKVTVYFPGERDTVVVKPRVLRPSLNWTEGKWRPCTGAPVEEDIRPAKQQKVGSLSSEDGKRISPSSHSNDEGKETCVN